MEAPRKHSSRSWYKPDPRSQTARMAMIEEVMRDSSRSQSRFRPLPVIPPVEANFRSNTRTRYRQAPIRNLMQGTPQSPRRQRMRYASPNVESLGGSASATSSADRYGAPRYRPARAYTGNKRLPKPVVLQPVPSNKLDMGRSWYLPKRPAPPRYAKHVGGGVPRAKYVKSRDGNYRHRKSEGPTLYVQADDTRHRGGLVKGWYGAFKRMFRS